MKLEKKILHCAQTTTHKQETARYLDVMLPAVTSLLQDQEARVRYYACESLYNITKVSRDHILPHFDRIFKGLCVVCVLFFVSSDFGERECFLMNSCLRIQIRM